MSSTGIFTTKSRFNPDHPPALALYCSDGRYTQPVEELLRHLGHDRLDTLTLPGGPGLLSLTSAGFVELDATKRGAGFLIVGHRIRDVFLIAHQMAREVRAGEPGGRLSQPWVVFAAAAFICFGLAGRALMTGLGFG